MEDKRMLTDKELEKVTGGDDILLKCECGGLITLDCKMRIVVVNDRKIMELKCPNCGKWYGFK